MRVFLFAAFAMLFAFAAPGQSRDRRPRIPFENIFEAVNNGSPRAPALPRRTRWGPEVTDYVARTSDNWKLVVHRYRTQGRHDPARFPVILCHGFGYNSSFFDLTPETSLARFLADDGFDVWVVDLRGAGQSSRWALTTPNAGDAILGRFTDRLEAREIPRFGFVSLDPKFANWTLDDHIDRDIPAILNLVKHRSGMPQVAWVGHSMGGNIMLAYLAKYGQEASVGKVLTIGSQLRVPPENVLTEVLLTLLDRRKREVAAETPVRTALAAGANRMFYNELNVDPAVFHAMDTTGQDPPSIGVIQQYLTLCSRGELYDSSQQFSYASRLNRIECPCLVVGGTADRIAPPEVQQQLLNEIGAQQRLLLLLGRDSGLSVDYGHSDTILGRKSREEVYPILARWLAGKSIGRTNRREP